ncbi:MAG: ABC transporter ATP-binding protein [Clostridia bacterium]|nr:ABC transporter ATP-binding protein [Clostridia bacterium]
MSEKQAVSVQLKDLVKVFPAYGTQGTFTAVNNVSLTAEPGEMVTLLGPSGCGKTTILRMVSGFEIPTSGKVLIGGKDVSALPPNKRNVGMMFQSYALFPHQDVFENVAYGLRIKRCPEKEIRERVKQVLELMQIEPYEERMPNQLSGGQQQRVALARAVVTEPSVLLFDEPLSNLDAKLREYMRDELRKIQQRVGITSIYVTHDQSEAMAISDKVVVMRSGIIEQVGTATGIYTSPDSCFVADFMGKANFLPVTSWNADGSAMVFGQTVHAQASAKLGSQQPVLMVRPENVLLDKTGPFTARVESATYMGQTFQYTIVCENTSISVADYMYHTHGVFKPGDQVHFEMVEPSLRLIPAEGAKA